jgi:hypothetical protein
MIAGRIGVLSLAAGWLMSGVAYGQANQPFFVPGNLVVAASGCGVWSGAGIGCPGVAYGAGSVGGYLNNYGDNQGSPLTLLQFTPNGTTSVAYVNSLVLPQIASGLNFPISAEYGSSSEGTLQLSGNGAYLTVGGYGVNAATYNANPLSYTSYPSAYSKATALAQSSSITGQSWTPVPRVVALIDANGNVNSTTALYNIFNTNNIRSAFTANGTSVYVSGQGQTAATTSPFGSTLDATGGVFYSLIGAVNNSPATITGTDAGSGDSQETNEVQIFNNALYVSSDSKEGSTNRSYIGTLGTGLPTSCSGGSSGCPPTQLSTYNNASTPVAVTSTGKLTLTAGETNGINSTGLQINLSAQNYWFANSSTLYVADTGNPKQTSATSPLGDGGLQKWVNISGKWELEYTLASGLNLVQNPTANPNNTSGTTGLYGLTGYVSGGVAYIFATNYTISDLDPTYLYGISDTLTATTNPGTSFTRLASAPADTNFKGVSMAPTIPAGNVEVTSVPSGLLFTSAGTGCAPGNYTTPLTLSWTPGSSCTLTITPPQAAPGVQYALQWQDGTTSPSDSVIAPATTATYTATFTTEYQLTTAASAGGTVSQGGYYPSGTNATVTATPGAGYYFVNFTGTTTSTNNPLTLDMTSPQSITANFAPVASQTITFGALPNQVYGVPPFAVSATASSGLLVSFASLTPSVCSVSGTTVTVLALGTCTVQATQSGDTQYAPATPVNQSFTVTAPQVMVGGVGSSSQFQSASLAAFQLAGGTAGNAGHWTFGNGGEIIDTREGGIVPETGTLSVVWNQAQTQVWFYLSVDTVAGNRAYFAQPRTTLTVLTPASTAGQNAISAGLWGADSPLPPAVLVAIQGTQFSAAFTDILPADAKFAMNRVNCGTATTATIGCLGYGTSDPNVGAPIQSAFSTSAIHPVNFNIYGTDPITGDAIPAYTVVPVGIAPIIMIANRSNASGLGQTSLFSDITYQATAQLLWTGTDCSGTAWGPYDAAHSFAVNPILREPLSGAMNTFEYNIMVQNLQGSTSNGYFSQESIFNSPYYVPSTLGAIQPATNNPLNGACPGGSPYAAGGPQGNRMRAIGTAEMVSAVQSTADSIGYLFFSYGNVSALANNANYGYLTYQGVDPINPSGSYTTPFVSGGLNWPGNGSLPVCTAPCPIAPGSSFPNIRTGAYRAWSLLRAVADAGSAALTNLQALATAEQNQINGTQADFVPFNATSDGDPGVVGYRSHFVPGMTGTPTFNFNGANTPDNGLGANPEAGGDVGGCLDYKYDPNLLNCRY